MAIPILENISKHINLSESEEAYFLERLGICELKKKQFLQRQGEVCNYISFVNTGILRAYHLAPNGKESTVMFATKNWWITDMYCFVNEKPAMVSITAVDNSTVLQLSKKDLDGLYHEIPAFNTLFRILMQNAYCREQLRMIQNLSLPAAERYESFINQYPQVASKVPLKQIASYIGVTPEFLSAIRAEKN